MWKGGNTSWKWKDVFWHLWGKDAQNEMNFNYRDIFPSYWNSSQVSGGRCRAFKNPYWNHFCHLSGVGIEDKSAKIGFKHYSFRIKRSSSMFSSLLKCNAMRLPSLSNKSWFMLFVQRKLDGKILGVSSE